MATQLRAHELQRDLVWLTQARRDPRELRAEPVVFAAGFEELITEGLDLAAGDLRQMLATLEAQTPATDTRLAAVRHIAQ
jgi:hypothetical protein